LQAADLQFRLGKNVFVTYAEQLELLEVQFEQVGRLPTMTT
jgi:hypothetical protein